MSLWGRRRIKERAVELLQGMPDGIASADLARSIKEEAGATPFSIIHSVVTNLPYESGQRVLEPKLGWLLLDRRKQESNGKVE